MHLVQRSVQDWKTNLSGQERWTRDHLKKRRGREQEQPLAGKEDPLKDIWKKKGEIKSKGGDKGGRGAAGDFRKVQLKLLPLMAPEHGPTTCLLLSQNTLFSPHLQKTFMLAGKLWGLLPVLHPCCLHCDTKVTPIHKGEVWDYRTKERGKNWP